MWKTQLYIVWTSLKRWGADNMIAWGMGYVVNIREECPDLQRIDVLDGMTGLITPAIVYPKLVGSCKVGMRVALNQTARRLKLGSGGFDFAIPDQPAREESMDVANRIDSNCGEHKNISRTHGHIMKLRYTPLQVKVHAIEEATHPLHHTILEQETLQNCPVIIAELHSMLPVICSVLQYRLKGNCRIAYVMTDGGALPAMMSSNVSELKQKHLLTGVVTVGHAFGGDIEAIHMYSGLLAAKHALQADVIIVAMGPGIIGSGTKYGHSGIEQGMVLNAVHTLGGHGIPVLRCSQADTRERHRGISHHTITSLMQVSLVSGSIGVSEIISRSINEKIWRQFEQHRLLERYEIIHTGHSVVKTAMNMYGLACYSMNRKYEDDPVFFDMAGAAAEVSLLSDEFKKSAKYAVEVRN